MCRAKSPKNSREIKTVTTHTCGARIAPTRALIEQEPRPVLLSFVLKPSMAHKYAASHSYSRNICMITLSSVIVLPYLTS